MASETASAIRQSLIECLRGILSPSQAIRNAAEEQLKMLETTDEYGIYLTEFTISPDSDLSGRQLASVLLKQYVEVHWCTGMQKFQPPVTPPQTKNIIREMLPQGLGDSSSKVRNSVAYALSKIASIDFPEDWPNLFDLLVTALNNPSPDLVHGAMRVLVETCREMAEDQLTMVTPIIMPHLYRIYVGEQEFGVRTRSRAVEIFATIVQTVEYMTLKSEQRTVLTPLLPDFVKALAKGLAAGSGPSDDIGLRKQIFKALGLVVNVFPKLVRQLFNDIMPPIWQVLTTCAEVYVRDVVNGDGEDDPGVDSDGEAITMDSLVYGVFEFTSSLLQQEVFHSAMMAHLPGFLFYALHYMQMTSEDIEAWTSNINLFVEDEDEETLSYSVRLGAKDLLMQVFDPGFDTNLTRRAPVVLWESIEKLFQQLTKPGMPDDPNRWKYFEVISTVLSTHSPDMMPFQELGQRVLQLLLIMKSSFQLGSHPDFLVGRIMELQASICNHLSDALVTDGLQQMVAAITLSQRPVLQVHACKALSQYCSTLRTTKRVHLLTPHVTSLTVALLSLISNNNNFMLQLGLETMVMILALSPDTTVACGQQICDLSLQLFLNFSQDHVLIDTIKDLIILMAGNVACLDVLHQRALPVLIQLVRGKAAHVMLLAATLDILSPIIRHTPAPLPEALLNECAAVAILVMETDDDTIMQNGGECLRAFVAAAGEQLATWPPEQDQKLLDVIVKATCELLHPKRPENSAMFVGRLVCVLTIKLKNQLTPKLNDILRAVLSKLQQVEKDINVQSLISIFARLLEFHLTDVVAFLDSVCGPLGHSALHFVLTRWCASQTHFFTHYEKTVCLLGLCHLLRHGLNTGDERLQAITVPGDEIFDPSEGIRTRSKSKSAPREVTVIPVVVKIFKLLLGEMAYQFELASRTAGGTFDMAAQWSGTGSGGSGSGEADNGLASGEGGEEDWEDVDAGDDDDDDEGGVDVFAGLFGDMDDFDAPKDPDLDQDSVMQIDLPIFLADFLLDIGRQPCLPALVPHLTSLEKSTLETLMQSGEKLQVLKQSRAKYQQVMAARRQTGSA